MHWLSIGAALLAVLTTTVGAWDRLTSGIRKSVVLGAALVFIAGITQGIQLLKEAQNQRILHLQDEQIERAATFLGSELGDVDEASGGAIMGQTAYVVDDEVTGMFALTYDDQYKKYKVAHAGVQKFVDKRPCASRQIWNQPCTTDGPPITLGKEHVDDLEAVAAAGDKLYLITSHSNGKNARSPEDFDPARGVLLQVNSAGEVQNATRQLRSSIESLFDGPLPGLGSATLTPWKEGEISEVMHVEGMAIRKGMLYLGLRAPLVNGKYACVLRAPVASIFDGQPQFQVFALNLVNGNDLYGIVSLEYDEQKDQILILGNHPSGNHTYVPRVWEWKVRENDSFQTPRLLGGELHSAQIGQGHKAEVVLLTGPDTIQLLWDAKGTGGQRAYQLVSRDLVPLRSK